jgi:hypothetical protein
VEHLFYQEAPTLKYRPLLPRVVFWSLRRRSKSAGVIVLTFFVLLAASATYACQAAISMTPDKARTLPEFVGGIATLSSQLNYITEQDSEVFAFYRNTPVDEMTDSSFLSVLRRPVDTRVIQQSWSSFFKIRTSIDPTGRWKALQDYLEANMTNLVIFRLPRDAPYGAQYDLYAVGVFNGKVIVGVQMFGVAT